MRQRTQATNPVAPHPAHLTGADTPGEPQHILVFGPLSDLPPLLVVVCDALDIALVPLRALHDLPLRLHQLAPVAAVGARFHSEAECCGVLRAIAAHHRDLPVLIMAADEPPLLGAIDVAEQLWGLTAVQLLSLAHDPQDVVGFVYQATRWRGTGRLLPVT